MTIEHSETIKNQYSSDQALLEALKNQAIRVPLIMGVVILVIAESARSQTPLWSVILWASLAIFMQGLRSTIIFKLPSQHDRPAALRLRTAARLSMINGLVLACSALLFNKPDDISLAIYSMIMIGLVAGTVATSHGYRPIFLGFVAPVLGAVIWIWVFTARESLSSLELVSIVSLVIALGGVLYASSRDVYASFINYFTISQQLESALLSEQKANAAKTRFLAAASHDLRQPLHTLSLLSAALTLRDLDERSATIAQNMNLTMVDLSSELDSLLDISKLDASVVKIKPTKFDIDTLVERVLSGYQQAADTNHIELVHEKCAGTSLFTDRFMFERLFRNLIDNAIKYTDSGSVLVSVDRTSDWCNISVKDTGIGIPIHEQENIWEEFYQLKNSERDRHKGLGLGLSIVARLTSLLDGEISMSSEYGEGTTFSIKLPMTSPSPSDNIYNSLAEKDMSGENLKTLVGTKVLVVDDDREIRLGTRLLLESYGLVVSEAVGTADAISALRSHNPDIALCDLRLPDSDNGFNTIDTLREFQPTLPIIIVSGETSPEQLQKADTSGVVFVKKPVRANQLLSKIYHQLLPAQATRTL
jgi:signal transduction histidine kinase/ActR/RegA family two-component response regulator